MKWISRTLLFLAAIAGYIKCFDCGRMIKPSENANDVSVEHENGASIPGCTTRTLCDQCCIELTTSLRRMPDAI